MKTPELKATILQMFKEKELHGYEVRRKLAAQDIEIDFGRLYKTLNEMMNEGLLDCRWEKSKTGPNKRLCKIGERGKKEVEKTIFEAIQTVHSTYGEYLANLPPSTNVFNKICNALKKKLKTGSKLAFIASNPSPMYAKLLQSLQSCKPEMTAYIISPKSTNLNLHEKITNLEGTYDSIPLRDKEIDLLIMDMPNKLTLEREIEEWRRVVSKEGTVAILAPTVLLHEKQDPLSIGDFVEKWEHVIVEKQEFVDSKIIIGLLKSHFLKVEEETIVHMTMIIASKPKLSE